MQRIAIIGAGLAGSFLAIQLAKKGYEVDIIERSSREETENSVSNRSYNLTIYDYAVQVFKDAGMWERLEGILTPIKGSVNYFQNQVSVTKNAVESYSFQRTELLKALLYATANNKYINYKFGKVLLDINKKDKQIIIQDVETKKFEVINYDVVIGADGVNSRVRMLLQQGQETNHTQEYVEWTYKQINWGRKAAQKLAMKNNYVYTWTNKQMILAALPSRDSSYSAVLMLPKNGSDTYETLNTTGRFKTFVENNCKELMPIFPEIVNQMLSHQEGNLVTIKTNPWHYKDFLVIIGDAAHGFLPFSGQGVSAALADCLSIGKLVDEYKGDWAKILPAFEEERKKHTDVIAEISKQSQSRYARTTRVNQLVVFEKWEILMNKLWPKKFQPPMNVMINRDPTKAKDYLNRQQKQKELFTWLGGWIWATILLKIYLLLANLRGGEIGGESGIKGAMGGVAAGFFQISVPKAASSKTKRSKLPNAGTNPTA